MSTVSVLSRENLIVHAHGFDLIFQSGETFGPGDLRTLLKRLALICCSVKGGLSCQRHLAAPLSKKRKDGFPVKVLESAIVFGLVY